jgi:hypothetical protein
MIIVRQPVRSPKWALRHYYVTSYGLRPHKGAACARSTAVADRLD